ASQTDGSYPSRDAFNTALFDDEYTQRNLQLRGNWRVAGHSRVSGYLGGSEREYPEFSERDFTGLTGRISYDWAPTGKLSLNLLARREIGAEVDLVDNFVVTESISITPAWALTSDISIGAGYEWRKRTYGGDPALGVIADVGKDDTTDIARLSGNYAPLRNLKFTVLVQHEARDSNNADREYDAGLVSAAVQFNW
ncbi:MAG: outer membrane beta-barrel protein, partial [Spongiibacteraceae bacterium]